MPDSLAITLRGLRYHTFVGILPEDLKLPDTDEPGTKRKTQPTHPATGKVTLDGKPLAGVTVALVRAVSHADPAWRTARLASAPGRQP